METLIAQAEKKLHDAKSVYQTWNMVVDILKTLNGASSPIGLTHLQDAENHIVGIPASQGIIDTRKEYHFRAVMLQGKEVQPSRTETKGKIIEVNIKPDPLNVIKGINLQVIPEPINMSITIIGPANEDGLISWHIDDERLIEQTNIEIPKIVLEELLHQVGPFLDKYVLKYDALNGPLFAEYTFNWPVYLIVPPEKSEKDNGTPSQTPLSSRQL